MNKNIKRTIAMALTIGAFSVVGQTNSGMFTTEANASMLDSSAANELTDLELTNSSGSSLDLYKDSDYNDELSDVLEVGETYYATTTSSSVVIDNIDGADIDNVRIFKENSDTTYKVDESISLSPNTTTILNVRVYENEYDKDKDYSISDYNQYIINVENTEEANDNVNGNKGLHKGLRDKNDVGNNGLHKGWNNEKGAWHYLDNDGKIKKGWLKDTDQSWYYLDNDGNMKTSWLKDAAGNWYYLDKNGKMKTSWLKDADGEWYYLENNGKMKTNWLKDTDGNWYYLQSSGKMAKNTTIDGYKLNVNGTWMK